MKKSKIKKSMWAIPEPLWPCLLSSLLYKLSLSLCGSPEPASPPLFFSSPRKKPPKLPLASPFPFSLSSLLFVSSSASQPSLSCSSHQQAWACNHSLCCCTSHTDGIQPQLGSPTPSNNILKIQEEKKEKQTPPGLPHQRGSTQSL